MSYCIIIGSPVEPPAETDARAVKRALNVHRGRSVYWPIPRAMKADRPREKPFPAWWICN